MPSGRRPSYKRKPLTRSKRRRTKHKKQRRGPVMRFHFSRLILLWILSLILCFGAYLYNRNFHPEKEVFLRPAADETESSEAVSVPDAPAEESVPAEEPGDTEQQPASDTPETPAEEGNGETAENPVEAEAAPTKVNPVPESAAQSQDYLAACAFVGETNVFNLGENNLLLPYSVYASEKLTLENYRREYVMLNGTTIRILSALHEADCPIYLMFGTETLIKNPPDYTVEQFRLMLNDVIATAPEAKIYVLSIPPVTAEAERAQEDPIKNSDIDQYNSLLLELCNKENIYFIDTNTALKNNEGKLDGHLATEDGKHLSAEGGMNLLSYVLTHVPAE